MTTNPQQDLFSLDGTVALVTGATGHLGHEIATALAMAGAHVLVNGRQSARTEQLVGHIISLGFSAEPCVFDVTDSGAIERALRVLHARKLNILVNNAYSGGSGTIEGAEPESYRESYEVTVVSAHNLLRATLASLRLAVAQDGDASVINIASMYGVISPDQRVYSAPESSNPPYYGAAKAALIQWSRYAACELGKEGIRVNCISPGPFPSKAVAEHQPEFVSQLAARVPLRRVATSDELRGPVLFLASRASSFVNGANLSVDGGWTAW